MPLAAQQPAVAPPTIDISLHLMAVGSTPLAPIRFATGPGTSGEVELKENERTGPYRYRGPNPVVFFRELNGADGQPVRGPVGSLRVEENMNQVLALAIPRTAGDSTGDEISFVAIDENRSVFAPGTLLLYNALPVRVGAVFGERRFVIEPGPSAPMPVKEFGDSAIPIQFWIETPGGSKLVLDGKLGLTPESREVMVLLPPRRKGSWIIQCVRVAESMDTPPAPAERATTVR